MKQIARHFCAPVSTIKSRFRRNELWTRPRGLAPQHCRLTSTLLELLHGLLLGDGSVVIGRSGRTPYLTVTQNQRRVGWLRLLRDELRVNGIGTRIIPTSFNRSILRSKCYVEFTSVHAAWYCDKQKVVPRTLHLTPRSLAHWFFGDGTNGDVRGARQLTLYTQGFVESDVEFLAEQLRERFGWNARVNKGPIIRINRQHEIDDFLNTVAPFTPPCLRYKLARSSHAS